MEIIEFGPRMAEEQVVQGRTISIRLPETPHSYYRHGWQSWSLAAWVNPRVDLPLPHPRLLYPMQHDPLHALEHGHNGSWVGAVATGLNDVLLLGSLSLDAHVALEDKVLTGTYDAGNGSWYIARGQEKAVFSRYAAKLGQRLGFGSEKPVPRVWCSWYSLYTAISEKLLAQVFHSLRDLPFDVIQVDDGWQRSVGDWESNDKFPSGMAALAEQIRSSGRRAGLWLAPLIAIRRSRLFRDHPAWFLRDAQGRLVSAGFNWGEQLYSLDTTHPEVLVWLEALMQQVRGWGFDYIKLDFLYGGALPGKRNADVLREVAYRHGLQALREGMRDDAYFLACGAPVVPSLGLCDALRVGPDVAGNWETERDAVLLRNPAIPGTRNAIRTVLNQLWLKPLVQPDPDVAFFRSIDCNLTFEQKHLLQSLALICGFKATSDLPQWLSDAERGQLRAFLLADPQITQVGPWRFKVGEQDVDFSSVMGLPDAPAGWKAIQSAALGWLANHTWALRIDHELGQHSLKKRIRMLERE